ncbi:hypothetical protein MGO_02997 [Candida albicans P76055]|nr:hypothetical protein MGO_02997 [Candida albicans P76055]
MEHLKDNVARTKLFLWKKAQTPEKVVTPCAQTESSTLQDSIPVTITGHREAPTTPRVADTTARKTMTTGVSEMDTSKHTISSNDEASPRKKTNSTGQSRSPIKDPGLNSSPNLQ